MKRRVCFVTTGIILLMIAGYYSSQLDSMMDTACVPFFDLECESYAYLLCNGQGGEYVGEGLEGGVCVGYTCVGLWNILCVNYPQGWYIGEIWCQDQFCPDCYPD